MDEETATEIVDRFISDVWRLADGITLARCSWTDWETIDDWLTYCADPLADVALVPDAVEAARAFAFLWTTSKDQPGFNQPGGNLLWTVANTLDVDDPFNWSEALAAQA
jgi:hypothetical protein